MNFKQTGDTVERSLRLVKSGLILFDLHKQHCLSHKHLAENTIGKSSAQCRCPWPGCILKDKFCILGLNHDGQVLGLDGQVLLTTLFGVQKVCEDELTKPAAMTRNRLPSASESFGTKLKPTVRELRNKLWSGDNSVFGIRFI